MLFCNTYKDDAIFFKNKGQESMVKLIHCIKRSFVVFLTTLIGVIILLAMLFFGSILILLIPIGFVALFILFIIVYLAIYIINFKQKKGY